MLKFFVTLLVLAGVFLAGVTLASDFNFSDMFGFGQSAEAEARAVAAQARAAVEIARITAETDRMQIAIHAVQGANDRAIFVVMFLSIIAIATCIGLAVMLYTVAAKRFDDSY